eukprot:TRINITY_DN34184_c0_g1_i1.p1 TRINITY_DN34184_c0_g1~~TRINITY_DN34184_c0_g1_i1.p1  ORF type:complete len:127 (-),score=15.56 TRINITY_DN34184_c0_g1_i1:12-392(-)
MPRANLGSDVRIVSPDTDASQQSQLLQISTQMQQLHRRVEQLESQLKEARSSASAFEPKSPDPLPSTRMVGATKEQIQRHDHLHRTKAIYGGRGDPVHLGGFTRNDTDGQSPALWTYLIKSSMYAA